MTPTRPARGCAARPRIRTPPHNFKPISRFWACLVGLAIVSACGGVSPGVRSNYVARDRILAAIDARDSGAPMRLRYNPAPCACPGFEVALAGRWVRANWPGVRTASWRELSQRLAATSAPQWPVLLRARGRIEREVLRTRSGSYAVTIEVAELLSP